MSPERDTDGGVGFHLRQICEVVGTWSSDLRFGKPLFSFFLGYCYWNTKGYGDGVALPSGGGGNPATTLNFVG